MYRPCHYSKTIEQLVKYIYIQRKEPKHSLVLVSAGNPQLHCFSTERQLYSIVSSILFIRSIN
ncbi:rCG62256 [Rattus norvegicus]|uniref:RCG62256 n=1 Tax=Rattus norvegicus TaxID=10116 RepID=A6HC81_RAT|nr:rCG62256 [Rattus norvegicus]